MVCEEFSHLDKFFEEGQDPQLIPHDTHLWGKNYFEDEVVQGHFDDNGYRESTCTKKNFFVLECAKVCRYAVGFVKNIKWMVGFADVIKEKQLISG